MNKRTKKKLIWASGITVLVLLIGYLGASWYFSGLILKFPIRSLDNDRQYREFTSFADLGLPEPESVKMDGEGVTLRGWLFRNRSGKQCAVIASHGHRSTRYGALAFARMFYQRGCHTLVFDARYHGASSGEFGTYGYYERRDLVKVVDYLAAAVGLERSQIGLFGMSMGGAISLQAAALAPDVAFVVADSPYSNFVRIVRTRGNALYGSVIDVLLPGAIWFAEWRSDSDFDAISARRDAPRLTMPVYLFHSAVDEYTPPEHSQIIFDAIPHERKVLHFGQWGSEHATSHKEHPDEYRALLYAFLDRYAPGF